MKLIVKVGGIPAMVVGYGPGTNGEPKAIIVQEGKLRSVSLNDLELTDVPRSLRKAEKHMNKPKVKLVRSGGSRGND